jgi:hypothetical protein
MSKPNLNLKHYGWVNAEVIWTDGPYLKLTFRYGFLKLRRISEVFNYTEILNHKKIYIDKNLKIVQHDFEE